LDKFYRSSAGQFRDFIEGTIWGDILQEMDDMREGVRDALETVTDVEEFYRFQGRAEVLRDLRLLPEQILEALEDEHESVKGSGEKPRDDIGFDFDDLDE